MNGINLKRIETFIEEIISEMPGVFVVDIKISTANDIKVFLDADDGITINKCVLINKSLYKKIEESALFADNNFSLEVSSADVDEPLKLFRQYKKNIGRVVEILLNDGTKISGKLTSADDEKIIIDERTGKGNKAISKSITILFNQIKQTKVLITF